MFRSTCSIVGFDSAWTDNPKAPGAVCIVRVDGAGSCILLEPEPASFARALALIGEEHSISQLCLVAIDQPTIVPNLTGCRPVDRVAGSLISWMGGGVQPANRSKKGIFDDEAPIWGFKEALGAIEDPEAARIASDGLFLIEVFPALALAGMDAAFCGRRLAPRYNPARCRTFKHTDWLRVVDAVDAGFAGAFPWLELQRSAARPRKIDQDKLDAVISALAGLHWLTQPRDRSMMIGDFASGYMITPVANGLQIVPPGVV